MTAALLQELERQLALARSALEQAERAETAAERSFREAQKARAQAREVVFQLEQAINLLKVLEGQSAE